MFVWSYVVIGNYSELNPKDCGISRVSTLVDTNCFEWHKGYDSSALKRGKLVGHSDAPWVALLQFHEEEGMYNDITIKFFNCQATKFRGMGILHWFCYRKQMGYNRRPLFEWVIQFLDRYIFHYFIES